MVRRVHYGKMGKAPTTPLFQAFYFVIVLLIFFSFWVDYQRVGEFPISPWPTFFGDDWGGSKSNISKIVSIGSSSVCGTSLESFKKRCFCNWFFNYSTLPTGRVILISFKVIFSPGLNLFLGTNVLFRSLFCFRSSLSLNSTFDNMPIFTNRSSSLFISSVAANGRFRFFLKMGRVFSFRSNFGLIFVHLPRPAENTLGKLLFSSS